MLQESFFKNKRVTVFGLGVNMGGVGTVRFLAEHGVREIIVTDIKKREELTASLEKLSKYKNITYVLGQHRPEDFTRVDMVIKNPIIPWTNEYIKLAEKNHVPVEMDSSLFFALCKAPIIGITGSKGKTTNSSLIAHILEKSGKRVVRVGIGQVGVLSMLGKVTPDCVVVFELSSWRLSALGRIKKSPHVAVVTNIYPDHLNYYKTLEAYKNDKKNIFLFQKEKDTLVANFDDGEVRDMIQDARGTVIPVSQEQEGDGDGVWIEGGQIWVRKQGEKKELMAIERIPLRGAHNQVNCALAAAATFAFGLSLKQIVAGLESFPGVAHRLELIAEKKGVRYYNDTTATIPEATLGALRSFDAPMILIAGGSDKNLSFDILAKEILSRSKRFILLPGSATEKLIHALKSNLPETEKERIFTMVESMQKAVELAAQSAEAGDIVLLSPGATSFGIFQNEFDRGEQFRNAVEAL